MAKKSKRVIKGVCHFFSEQGMEGGVWALQDEENIVYRQPGWGIWGYEDVWDALKPERKGKCIGGTELLMEGQWCPLPDPLFKDPDYQMSTLGNGGRYGDKEADKRLMEKYGFRIKYAAEQLDEKLGAGNWQFDKDGVAIDAGGNRYDFGVATEPRRPYGLSAGQPTRCNVQWEDGVVERRDADTLLTLQWEYGGLHFLEDGDYLTIYDKNDETKIVWEGIIDLEPTKKLYMPRSYQRGVSKEDWSKWFISKECTGVLKKK